MYLIYNVVFVSGVHKVNQLHTYGYIFFRFFSHIGYHTLQFLKFLDSKIFSVIVCLFGMILVTHISFSTS